MNLKIEQKKGQIIMAARIIQNENNSKTGIPKVSRRNIADWLKEDVSFVENLMDTCSRLDERMISKKVVEANKISDSKKFLYWNGLQLAWESYQSYIQGNSSIEELNMMLNVIFQDETKDEVMKMMFEFLVTFLKEIKSIEDEELFTVDVLLEIAHLTDSEYECMQRYVRAVQNEKDDN